MMYPSAARVCLGQGEKHQNGRSTLPISYLMLIIARKGRDIRGIEKGGIRERECEGRLRVRVFVCLLLFIFSPFIFFILYIYLYTHKHTYTRYFPFLSLSIKIIKLQLKRNILKRKPLLFRYLHLLTLPLLKITK